MVSIYVEAFGRCQEPGCGKAASFQLMRSGTDRRGVACSQHVTRVGKRIAAALNEDYVG